MNRDLGIPSLIELPDEPVPHHEQRRHRRRQLAVRCWMSDGQNTLFARVHDVSLGGFSIRAPSPFHSDAELQLAIMVGGAIDDGATVAIRGRGRVVWVTDGGTTCLLADKPRQCLRWGAPRMGAEFLHFDEGERLLRRLVSTW